MNRKEIIAANEISEIRTFTLNGFEQKVMIEGKTKDLPVLISLHGGPGSPVPFGVSARGLFKELTDKCILVCWDQLGCGANYKALDDSFGVDSFVAMTIDLIEEIKKLFPNNKIILFSTSWGSILSAKVLENNPHAVDAVINYGQIVKNMLINEEIIFTLENSSIPSDKLEKVKKITTDNFTNKDLAFISQMIMKFTDGYMNKSKGDAKISMGPMIRNMLQSPDYKLKDCFHALINGYQKNNTIWKDVVGIDLTETLSKVEIPYILLQGDTDIVTSTNIVKELVEKSGNTNLKLKIMEGNGHVPGVDIKEIILPNVDELCS